MDEYAEIYFLEDEDDDYRNAPRDHRTSSGRVMVPSRSSGSRTRVVRPVRRPTSRGVVSRPVVVAQQEQRPMFGNLTGAELVEIGAKVLASIQPLPAPPVSTGKMDDDVANLITYQGALALHAKRDEQLRTIGDLIAKALS
jgi:hypothetical protein